MATDRRIEEYVRADGTIPFRTWFEHLDHHAAAKVTTAVARLSLGNASNVKWLSGIGELQIDWGPGYRLYLAKDGATARTSRRVQGTEEGVQANEEEVTDGPHTRLQADGRRARST